MKIETITKSFLGQSVQFSAGVRAEFGYDGIAEVPDSIGEMLCEVYNTQIFPEGKAIQPPAAVRPNLTAQLNASTQELHDKLQSANRLVNDYQAQMNSAKEGERIWRTQCEEIKRENNQLRELISGAGLTLPENIKEMPRKHTFVRTDNTVNTTPDNPVKDDTTVMREKLEIKTVKELIEVAESLSLPIEEYKKLKKPELVDYILKKATENVTT